MCTQPAGQGHGICRTAPLVARGNPDGGPALHVLHNLPPTPLLSQGTSAHGMTCLRVGRVGDLTENRVSEYPHGPWKASGHMTVASKE